MLNRNTDYLGRGWSFPPTFDRSTKDVQMVSAEEDIRQSLLVILSTHLGERVMQPDFGCDLQDFLFEPLSPSVTSTILEQVRTAIIYHENRIRVKRLELTELDATSGLVQLEIDYIISSTNSRFNFVFPFYLQEGANTVLPVS